MGEVDSCGMVVAMDAGSDFASVFRREFPRLAGYCAGLVNDRELGADLAQEALARTWGRWSAVDDPRAYSYLVATNLVRRYWKTRSKEEQARRALMLQARRQSPPDRSIWAVVAQLPERLRAATLLHYYADLPVEQVARLLHRPQGTIRQHLFEARRLLAVALDKED